MKTSGCFLFAELEKKDDPIEVGISFKEYRHKFTLISSTGMSGSNSLDNRSQSLRLNARVLMSSDR